MNKTQVRILDSELLHELRKLILGIGMAKSTTR